MRILAGDIGGTKSFLATFSLEGGRPLLLRDERFESRRFDALAPMALSFLKAEKEPPDAACFGIAGPVIGGECRALNLPWTVKEDQLSRELGGIRVEIVNDFQAIGHGLPRLAASDLEFLQSGHADPHGPIALIGAGTGLGEAFLLRNGGQIHVHPSEGGHADFAARTELEWRLHRRLNAIYGHVSYERILSGAGLNDLYRFLVEEGIAEESLAVRTEMEATDPAAVVSTHALSGDDRACSEALGLFIQIYGAEAGNLALKVMATGGVYIAGGIAPRILDELRQESFIRSFREKGRHAAFLSSIPVCVVVNEKAGLFGAAELAAERFRSA